MKRRSLFSVAFITFAVGLAGCSNSGETPVTSPGGPSPIQMSLAGHAWRLVSLEGQPVLGQVDITATFSDGRVAGSAGCNQYFGGADVVGSQLTVTPLASTRMFCNAPGVMEQEERYLQVLGTAVSFTIAGSRLEIASAGNPSVLIFTGE